MFVCLFVFCKTDSPTAGAGSLKGGREKQGLLAGF